MSLRAAVNPHLDIEQYDPEADLMALNMGPQHPSTHGVLRIKLFLDGERIVKAVPYPGYLHRGVEKLCEKLTYVQICPIVDKHDYVSAMLNEQAFIHAIEMQNGIEVAPRAKVLRVILGELQRYASHLLWLGTFTLDIGGTIGGGASLMMYTFRDREMILDQFEAITGARMHYNAHCVGGNRHDIPDGWQDSVAQLVELLEARLVEYQEQCTNNDIFKLRTIGVGTIDKQTALELGLSGPNLRASGVDHDLRRDTPYFAYDQIDVNVPVEQAGDCYARYLVRIAEMAESLRIVKELIHKVPDGPLGTQKPVMLAGAVKIKGGQFYSAIEGPRGELGTYIIGGGDNRGASPYRCKIRPPCLHAVAALAYMLPGHTVSDVVAILGSLDPIMGEVDR